MVNFSVVYNSNNSNFLAITEQLLGSIILLQYSVQICIPNVCEKNPVTPTLYVLVNRQYIGTEYASPSSPLPSRYSTTVMQVFNNTPKILNKKIDCDSLAEFTDFMYYSCQ